MLLSKSKHMISTRIKKIGSEYNSGSSTFYGLLMKANVSQDLPRSDHVIYAAFNASVEDGELISRGNDYYIPLQTDIPNLVEGNVYKKVFLRKVNASGDLKNYDYPAIASFDAWDVATGSTGWIAKKTSVYANFERISLRADVEDTGQVESADFLIMIPWSVNASHAPAVENRFTDRQDRNWKIEDVDDKTFFNQAYVLRVSADDR